MKSADPIALLITGAEVLDGRVLDTNSNYIAGAFRECGLVVGHLIACQDHQPEIEEALRFLVDHHEVVLISGGLGPTTDDLTREAVAAVCNCELVQIPEVVTRMEQFFRERRRQMSETNLKQALLPKGAAIIENPHGTAPGFCIECSRNDGSTALVFAMPGVPSELRPMFNSAVLPMIRKRLGVTSQIETRVLRVFALPEAEVGLRIERLQLAPEIEVSYRAMFPEIQVILKSRGDLKKLDLAAESTEIALGPANIFSKSLESGMERVVHDLLIQRNLTVAVAESCTGGLIGNILSKIAGASKYFLGGVISYSNEIKVSQLDVDEETLRKHGAVSPEVVMQMAQGVRVNFGSSLALSVSGIAGPDGGSEFKPVGTFFIGISTSDDIRAFQYFYPSGRERIQTFAAYCAIDLLRRYLLKLPLRNETPQ